MEVDNLNKHLSLHRRAGISHFLCTGEKLRMKTVADGACQELCAGITSFRLENFQFRGRYFIRKTCWLGPDNPGMIGHEIVTCEADPTIEPVNAAWRAAIYNI